MPKKQNIFRIHEKLNKIFAISVDDDDDIRYNDHVDLDVNVWNCVSKKDVDENREKKFKFKFSCFNQKASRESFCLFVFSFVNIQNILFIFIGQGLNLKICPPYSDK